MTIFKDFLDDVMSKGAEIRHGYGASDGRMYEMVAVIPPSGGAGNPYIFIDLKPEDRLTQLEILSAKRVLMMF